MHFVTQYVLIVGGSLVIVYGLGAYCLLGINKRPNDSKDHS